MTSKTREWSGPVSSVRLAARGFFAGQHRGMTGMVVRKPCSEKLQAERWRETI
ncbi:MAG: hypothetical protein AAF441_25615 [Pseudomonadota bacterium]